MGDYSFKMESDVIVKLMSDLANTTSLPHITIMLEELEDLAHKVSKLQLLSNPPPPVGKCKIKHSILYRSSSSMIMVS